MANLSILRAPVKAKPKRVNKENLHKLTIPQQIKLAYQPGARIAAAWGTAWGASIPAGTWYTAHYEVLHWPWMWGAVVGGLAFSAATMYSFALRGFRTSDNTTTKIKAAGFVLLSEGLMTFSHSMYVSLGFLFLLCLTNAVSAAVNLQAIE